MVGTESVRIGHVDDALSFLDTCINESVANVSHILVATLTHGIKCHKLLASVRTCSLNGERAGLTYVELNICRCDLYILNRSHFLSYEV